MTSVPLDAKLAAPPLRPGSPARMDLVERVRLDDRQVVVVTAPAGYGKSTFLRQWAESEDRPVAWVSLEATDDDEAVVVDYIAAALDRIGSLGSDTGAAVAHPHGAVGTTALTRLAKVIWGTSRPTVLMIDDIDLVRTPESIDALSWLSEHVPPTIRLAVASRERAPLPLARLRAHGRLLEVGTGDLAMSEDDARELLERAGVRVSSDHVASITVRTEGWPAGIHLAALSLRAGGGTDVVPPGIGVQGAVTPGDGRPDRYVTDFLRTEILDRSPPELQTFLVRTSPLDRFDAQLCDHALGRSDSAEMLAELERTNAFLVPLDERSLWYRYHHLFRDLLLSELRRREPDQEVLVRHRAAGWLAAHDDLHAAIEYAHQAGDDQLVASLLVATSLRQYRAGHLATLDRWFGWFDVEQLGGRAPMLAILGGWIWALRGRTRRAERWEDAVAPYLGALEPHSRATYAALRAVTGRLPLDEQVRESRIAMDGLPPGDAWRATAFLGGGVQEHLRGDTANADLLLTRAIDIGLEDGGIPSVITALGIRAHLAALRDDWGHAEELTRQARSLISDHGLESYVASTTALVMGARVAVHHGAVAVAQADIARIQRIRPVLTAAIPYLAAHVRLELARAYLGLGEIAGARLMLSEVADVLAVRPGIAPLAIELAALRVKAGGMGVGRPGVASLTTAELRLLGYLPSHLSFREIAERLFVSINTVKSQAISIYSKLGVSSRGSAIEAAVATGLLDPSVTRFPSVAPDIDPARIAEASANPRQ